ncbi:hypothetical protein IscW_ISCW009904 [Ixodes scapularis]|uniref:Uncharacterized protein n=1 Tax=Ixodes scapularis TaxID=6945 RepID=B7PYI0_IXOSC|nr:hypothetical protein IscW_ISCW009904 [Ixodes scapularis]|eukprot:XP_002403137.1 hypothetical protein IscW_ISCW009904 [Ixodes scapularis]
MTQLANIDIPNLTPISSFSKVRHLHMRSCAADDGENAVPNVLCRRVIARAHLPPSQEEPKEVRRLKKARCPDSPEEDKTLAAITELAKVTNIRFQQLDEHLTDRFQKMKERSQQVEDRLTRLEQA